MVKSLRLPFRLARQTLGSLVYITCSYNLTSFGHRVMFLRCRSDTRNN